ncbi:MAG: HAMP domain-containing histidine kinase, partial [Phycisphaerales bacterium]|nr:HAMP domain-containing histidine kinase [Phycisphaerales bacterium]
GEFGKLSRSFNRMVGELERSEEQRRSLTADVAHELRTPLHILQGNLEGLIDGVYQPTPDHLHMMLDETQLISRLVDDLRTLSLAESGHLPLHIEDVPAADLLADVATSFSAPAESAGIAIRVEAQSLNGHAIPVDAMRINQVLGNLVANALRYTPAGGTITLSGAPVDGGVRLKVSDTGSGIAPDDLPHIFDRFWKADKSRSREGGSGSGLGLAIARQLVHLHGGQIDVKSQPDRGTVFTIDLPNSV